MTSKMLDASGQGSGRLAASGVVVAIILLPGVAWAAEPTALERLSTEVMNVLVPVFVALVGGLATWLLKKLKEKTGIEVSDAAAESWFKLAHKAALRGAEYARNKAKDLTEGETIPGPEVLELAANWAIDMGKSLKLPEMGREKLEGLIEAELFEMRWLDNEDETI
jgi:hypothetical protein